MIRKDIENEKEKEQERETDMPMVKLDASHHGVFLDTSIASHSQGLHARYTDNPRCYCNLSFAQHRVAEQMSVVVHVGLKNGKTVALEAGLDESVSTLRQRAQAELAVAKGRLLDSGGLLDHELTVKEAKLETATSLTLQIVRIQCQIQAS